MINGILLAAEEAETYIIDFTELPLQMAFHAAMVLVLFFVLGKLIFKPVLKMMKTREDAIQADIDAAKAEKENAEALRGQYEQKLAEAAGEKEAILASSYKQARKREEEIVNEARNEAERIRERARRDSEQEIEKAREELKNEAVELAGMMAGKIVENSLTEGDKERLLNDAIEGMENEKWQN